MIDAEIVDEQHVFTAVERHPNGISVVTTIRVPVSVSWQEVRECSEVACMASNQAMTRALNLRKVSLERAPF
jgi:hypothetical protein